MQAAVTKPQRQNTLERRKKSEFHKPILALTSHFSSRITSVTPVRNLDVLQGFRTKWWGLDADTYAGSQAVRIFLVPEMWLISPSARFGCQRIIQNEAGFSKHPHCHLPHQQDECFWEKNVLVLYAEKGFGGRRWRENPWVNLGPHAGYKTVWAADLHLQPGKSSPQNHRDT